VARIVFDLHLETQFPEFHGVEVLSFFETQDLGSLSLQGFPSRELFERLIEIQPDADMYFACLATLHKARLKYEMILESQPLPTLEQVGPRGLLQFGKLSASALTGLLFWRKWFFDIDNRAGQETGYLFEPILAYAIGGTPAPSRKSPVKRHTDPTKGRQVDCVLGDKAYEFKIRVTIAASGQGRWKEELDFPLDCRESGYTPVLVVLDGTGNLKLSELERAFTNSGGEVFKGEEAWRHFSDLAGDTMSMFLDLYIKGPIDNLIQGASEELPNISAQMSDTSIDITVGEETLSIRRGTPQPVDDSHDSSPDDVSDNIPA
jgi:hypothetical protein